MNKLWSMLLLTLLMGCSSRIQAVKYPEPQPLERPNLTEGFRNCDPANGPTHFRFGDVCVSRGDVNEILTYIIRLETELAKCSITVQEINKQQ